MPDLDDVVRRAQKAANILGDDLVIEAKEHIEAELWRQFKQLAPSDEENLRFVKSMQYFHSKYFDYFKRVVEDGKMASLEIERKKKGIRERLFG